MSTGDIFALDIGTRKIAGLIMAPSEEGYVIKHASMHQQLPGAMADGQIHHIAAVARVIGKVKAELEEAYGAPLERAAVAAAGRSLITATGQSTLTFPISQTFTADTIRTLELDAVWDAINKLSGLDGRGVMDSYLCVGYSVIQNYLDGEPIGSLLNHQGKEAQVKVIATFLPRIVIDSLGTALEDAGLIMDSLTLEPIAAMQVVIPPTMRMLNIALVDVGAGTSDLAVSAEGTIKGYGMVSYAGDAITAGIAESFLLDTKMAEKVKVEISPEKRCQCTDVLGNTLSLTYQEVLEAIEPRVQTLAEKISERLLELNGTAPKGVILIGGGSLTPGFDTALARCLGLPANLVRVRSRDSLENVAGVPEFAGPQAVTPIGIGATHLGGGGMQLIRVTVNEQRLQVLRMTSSTVGDSLLYAGIVPGEFAGRPGPAYTVELNGRCITLAGTLGNPPLLLKNGDEASLDTPINDGDQITVRKGKPGHEPQITLGEFTEARDYTYEITLNGSPLKVEPEILVNGNPRPLNYVLRDRDTITVRPITNFKGLFDHLQIPLEREITFFLNNVAKTAAERLEIRIDGVQHPLNTPLRDGISVEYERKGLSLREILNPQEKQMQGIEVTINDRKVTLQPKHPDPVVNGQKVSFDYKIRPHDRVEFTPEAPGTLNHFIVTDIFRVYEPEEEFLAKGGIILLNGVETGFTTSIKHGDILQLIPYGAETANS